jgi:hypothetical protein
VFDLFLDRVRWGGGTFLFIAGPKLTIRYVFLYDRNRNLYRGNPAQTAAVRFKKNTVKLSNRTYQIGANSLPLGFGGLPLSFFLEPTARTTVKKTRV